MNTRLFMKKPIRKIFTRSLQRTTAASVIAAASAMATASNAPPCDFKGLAVGDTKSPTEIMAIFGVKAFKLNPPDQSNTIWDDTAVIEKFGSTYALEVLHSKIGPFCQSSDSIPHCRIPFGSGVGIGNHDDPVSVFVSFRKGIVTEIDVNFDAENWDDYLPIFQKKYGYAWRVERDPNFAITLNLKTKDRMPFERISMNSKALGQNRKTGDQCMISITNADIFMRHLAPLYQGVLVIKLVSNNI